MRMGYKSNKKQDDFLGLYPIFLLILFVLLKNIIIAQELQPQKKSIEDYILWQNSKLISSTANPNKYSKLVERYNSLLIEKSNPQYKHKLDSLYKLQKLQKIKSNNTQNNETWQSLGPKTKILSSNPNAFGNGRVNCLSFRKVGNDEHIYAGTALGGLYLTNNKINSLTNSPIWNEIEINGHYHLGISDVKNDVSLIDVNNNEIKFDIVIATGDAQGAFFSYASNGILASTNEGKDWVKIFDLQKDGKNINYNINRMQYIYNQLYIATTEGLFILEVTDLEPAIIDVKQAQFNTLGQNVRDFDIFDDNLIYSTFPKNEVENAKIFLINLNNNITEQINLSNELNGIDSNNVLRIAFSHNNQYADKINLIGVNKTSFNTEFIAKYDKNLKQITKVPIDSDPVFKQGFYNLCIENSPYDENIVYFGGVNLFKTDDNFKTLKNIGSNQNNIHVDHHNLYFSQNFNRIYSVNDGGIYQKSPIDTVWNFISEGISANQLYNVSLSNFIENEIWINSQDNGITKALIGKDSSGKLLLDSAIYEGILTGDGMKVINSKFQQDFYLAMVQKGEVYYTFDNWKKVDKLNLPFENTNWITKLKTDENQIENYYKKSIYFTGNNVKSLIEDYYLGRVSLTQLRLSTKIDFNTKEKTTNLNSNVFLKDFKSIDENNIDEFIVYTHLNKDYQERYFSLVAKKDKLYSWNLEKYNWEQINLGFEFDKVQNILLIKSKEFDTPNQNKTYLIFNITKNQKSEIYIVTIDNLNLNEINSISKDVFSLENISIRKLNVGLPEVLINDISLNYYNNDYPYPFHLDILLATDLGVYSMSIHLNLDQISLQFINDNLKPSIYTSISPYYLNNTMVVGSFGRGAFVKSGMGKSETSKIKLHNNQENQSDTLLICEGSSVQYQINNPKQNRLYIWSDGVFDVFRNFDKEGDYKLYGYNNQRLVEVSNTLYVRYKDKFNSKAEIIGDKLCPKDSLILNITIQNNFGENLDKSGYKVYWNDGDTNFTKVINKSGKYNYFLTSPNECTKVFEIGDINIRISEKYTLKQINDSLKLGYSKIANINDIIYVEWFLNDSLIHIVYNHSGNNIESIKVDKFGKYKAKLVYDGFCFDFSNELNILSHYDIQLRIYPNPFSEDCEIEITNPKLMNIGYDIFDANSKMIASKLLGNSIFYKQSLNFSEKSIGNYYIILYKSDNNKIDYFENKEASGILVKMK
ncbi:MAG: hypothetical protein ACOVNU_01835 [Candidatus Kapaibacteriota bacterium]